MLIAATPAGRRLMDAADALPALAGVAPHLIAGTRTAHVVEMVDPSDPQAVLTRLRTAAADSGPLLVHLIGQVVLDRRQRLPHLALARTAPATVRYTALPWHWLATELRGRAAETVVLADLVADADAWELLSRSDGPASLRAGIELYGTLSRPPGRRGTAVPLYSQAVAGILRRAAERPPVAVLHRQAVARSGLVAGQFLDLAGGLPDGHADGAGPPVGRAPRPLHVAPRRPASAAPGAAAPPSRTVPPRPITPPSFADPLLPLPSVGAVAPVTGPDAPEPPTRSATPLPPSPPVGPPTAPPSGRGPGAGDPHPAILAAAREGRHSEAAAIVAVWEQHALRTHGAAAPETIHWLEVRADLARLAGEFGGSCRLWMSAARARLGLREASDDPELVALVDRAHHCWWQLSEPELVRGLGRDLLELRRAVPGPRPGGVEDVRRRLAAAEGT